MPLSPPANFSGIRHKFRPGAGVVGIAMLHALISALENVTVVGGDVEVSLNDI